MDLFKRNKKETKVWHWLVVDVLVVVAWFIGGWLKSNLNSQYGAYNWLAYPITYFVLFILLSVVPILPSGIRSRYRYVMVRTLVLIIVVVIFLGVEIPKVEQNVENTISSFMDSL